MMNRRAETKNDVGKANLLDGRRIPEKRGQCWCCGVSYMAAPLATLKVGGQVGEWNLF